MVPGGHRPSKISNEIISINLQYLFCKPTVPEFANNLDAAKQNQYILLFVRNEVCGLSPPTPCQCFWRIGNPVCLKIVFLEIHHKTTSDIVKKHNNIYFTHAIYLTVCRNIMYNPMCMKLYSYWCHNHHLQARVYNPWAVVLPSFSSWLTSSILTMKLQE